MCTSLLVINKLFLGNRELGYELYDMSKGEAVEMTAGQIRQAIKGGRKILGVKISEENEIITDREKYYMQNLMKKVHINKLEPLYDSETNIANVFYYVTGTSTEGNSRVYHVVNSRFGRETITGEKLKALYEIGVIAGGVKIEEDKILVSECIEPVAVVEVQEKSEETKQLKKVKQSESQIKTDKNQTSTEKNIISDGMEKTEAKQTVKTKK